MPTPRSLFDRQVRWLLLFVAGHFLLSLAAIDIRGSFSDDSIFWGLSGLSSAVLAQTPAGWRRYFALGVMASTGAGYLIIGTPTPVALGLAAASATQAMVAAYVLRRQLPQGRRIVRMRDIQWLTAAAIVSAALGSGLGCLVRWLESGSVDPTMLGTWFMANALGVLVGTPVVFALFSLKLEPPPELSWAPTLTVAAVTALFFSGAMWASAASGRNFSYLMIVPVMISAVWLGQRHTALLVGGLSIAVAVGTIRGSGPFAATESPFDALLAAQLFMSVVQLTALTVGVESSRRRDVIAELDGILAATLEGVLVVDETGVIRHTNTGSEAILAADPGELIGQLLSAFLPLDEIDDHESLHLTRAQRKDGTTFWAEVSRGEIFERSGRRRIAVVVRDVTGRIETEEKVRRLQDEFVANMTHELKTPLTAIIGFSDWLLSQPHSSTTDGDLETILNSALSMKTLIDDILDFRRVAGAEGAREPVDLRSIVERSLDLVRPAALDLDVEISTTFADSPTVNGDAEHLRHAVQNVLSNAVKYSNRGGMVEVELRVDGNTVVLTVIDHGIGIPSADQERLFERFFRAANTGDVEGTGLGLALVRQVVERHGGDVELSSTVGEGTLVRVSLPLAPMGLQGSEMEPLEEVVPRSPAHSAPAS